MRIASVDALPHAVKARLSDITLQQARGL